MVSQLIASLVQLGVFIFIPYIAFIFRRERSENFLRYVGLYRTTRKAMVHAIGAALLFLLAAVGYALFDNGIVGVMQSPGNIVGSLRGNTLAWESILLIMVVAWIKTSLSEEIFFRGFIGRRLIKRFGLPIGNRVQALVFGVVHAVLFYILIDTAIAGLLFVFLFYAVAGWIIGYINERYGNGSILPGWVSHGIGNTAAFFLIDFVLS